jgi:hypothetical protein
MAAAWDGSGMVLVTKWLHQGHFTWPPEAGIRVHYCAEEFENDGNLASTILENIKCDTTESFPNVLQLRNAASPTKILIKDETAMPVLIRQVRVDTPG